MTRRLACVVVLSSVGLAHGPTPRPTERTAADFAVAHQTPLHLHRRLLFIDVVVGDQPTLSFLLDTGAGGTAIDAAVARRLSLPVAGTTTSTGANGSVTARQTTPVMLGVAGVSLGPVPLVMIDLRPMAAALGRRVDGVIGFALFRRHVADIDLDTNQLRLHSPVDWRPPEHAHRLPIVVTPSGLIHADLAIDTRDGRRLSLAAVIDSGSQRDVAIYRNGVARHQLHDRTRRYETVTEVGSENIPMVNLIDVLPVVRFGDRDFRDVRTVLMTDAPNTVRSQHHDIEALVGQGLLLSFNITYDYTRTVAYLRTRAARQLR